MINTETARAFNNNVCDGFVQPTFAWSATTPSHINDTGGSGMTSNFWVGNPEDVRKFANSMAEFYQTFYNNPDNFTDDLEDYESVSVAYWEKNGIAMCADLCTSDQIYDMLPCSLYEDVSENLRLVLTSGNDNNSGLMLQDRKLSLSVEERILLAYLMRYDSTAWVCEDVYRKEYLKDFSDDDIVRLKAALQK